MIYRTAALVCLAGLPVALAAGQEPAAVQIPVTSVTLYRSGVGAIERQGTVAGDAQVRLSVTADQIDDLLKSLVVMDFGGGRVGAITYTADEPVTRLLEALGVSTPDQLSLNRILAGFKGAEVEIEATGRDAQTGRILGVDVVNYGEGEVVRTTRYRVSLLTASGIVTVHDDEIRSVEFADEELRADFEALLEALALQRTETSRALEIEFRGEGERQVRAIYTQETPVWKTSYRVVIPDESDGTLRLQGWAIVENPSDSDWQDISLSLVAGRPVGFTMPLSQPLYMPRPAVPVPVEHAARPKTYAAMPADAAPQAEMGARVDRMARGGLAPASAGRLLDMNDAMESTFASAASSGESGEVFFFQLDDPVTIGRRQSAMIPILTDAIEGRRVSISSPSDGIGHPMLGLEMTNSTDLKLMPGPVSVYDGTKFAGDAQIGYVGAGDDRMLAFGVDLDVESERKTENRRERIEKLTIRDGVIIQRTYNQIADAVTLTNRDKSRGRTVIVEINALEGWELESKTPVYESAPGLHRFEVAVGPGQTSTLEATQSRVASTQLALTSVDLEQMIRYHRSGAVSEGVLEAFRGYAERRAAADDLGARIRGIDAETERLSQDQERIRRLMGSLNRQDELHGRYLRTLEQHEDRLEALRAERDEASAELERRQTELNEYVRNLSVE